MKERILIREIKDTDFDSECQMGNMEDYKVRRASRGVLIHEGKIALLNVTKHNFHKLPGGGIDGNETVQEAFKRELLEEAGCNCEILDEGGIIIEWRDQFKILQINYVFLAKVVGDPKESKLMEDEIEDGFILEWVLPGKIEGVLKKDNPANYEGQFITTRDKAIIEFYKDYLNRLIPG
ncbi:NUDIX domain-containing protein [Candidatus Woesebacteria bacterium]|nr:NUDIX domain-containing protein [Candidatus Woesebacteria bacterium]